MENRIKKMYSQDCGVLLIAMIALWSVLAYVSIMVSSLAPNYTVRTMVFLVAAVAGSFTTAALFAVLAHLRKNRIQLYTEEILCLDDHN